MTDGIRRHILGYLGLHVALGHLRAHIRTTAIADRERHDELEERVHDLEVTVDHLVETVGQQARAHSALGAAHAKLTGTISLLQE